ncbi:unnamed protein product [Rotaria magnacalcarata]|uniref:Uncharacterized protein n=1 Tax=Rotaria magnacalcarata TaxID=392030 RepID=A0A814WXP9_9BILA|nr:unnamed protein product [Rotaria magnacalcarata]CAF1208470.1 unnamed protein product [Rotaria magnacalcarata]CAF1920042.1 unnamed protein product [Rotaria magnacalcarata]CAF1935704.1 unnamed protein product [Rotaria magnacalcarata]CAF2052233.1 unnamed protein product [Rotaria magnacalcarata]
MSSFAHQRQVFLRQLSQACPDSMSLLKTYVSDCLHLISPSYKKTRDPLAMKELSSKCPSCSHIYSSNCFQYRGKLHINRRLHHILAIRRKHQRIPAPNTYKRRLLDNFTTKSRSKLIIKCFQCGEIRKFQGATRKDLSNKIVKKVEPVKSKPFTNNNAKLKETFDKVSCRFLKKESQLRSFLEQL